MRERAKHEKELSMLREISKHKRGLSNETESYACERAKHERELGMKANIELYA